MKVVTVVGARPQFIKEAPVSRALRARHQEILVHTGQHYDPEMSDVFFRDLDLPPPDHHLGVGSGSHGTQTGLMLERIERVLERERPDWVLVYGDTNSTIAGALAGVKLHLRVAHVEAGLRSFDRRMPEEINRVACDHVSDLLLAPTPVAMEHLRREGLEPRSRLVGDVMVDALQQAAQRGAGQDVLGRHGVSAGDYLLLTLHRPHNVDDPARLAGLMASLGRVDRTILFTVHPRTRAVLERHRIPLPPNVRPLPPLGYLEFVALQSRAARIVTDSGGVQKEAYVLGVPCVTVRSSTEWPETVEDGWNVLVGDDLGRLEQEARSFRPTGSRRDRYGTGDAAQRIVRELERFDAAHS